MAVYTLRIRLKRSERPIKDFNQVLKILENKDYDYIHKRLYRNLLNPDCYTKFQDIISLKDETIKPELGNKAHMELADRLSELLGAAFKLGDFQRFTPPVAANFIQNHFKDYNSFLVINLWEIYRSVGVPLLDAIIGKKIKDERLLRLIHKFKNAGFLDDFKEGRTYSKTLKGNKLAETLMEILFIPLEEYLVDQSCRGSNGFDKINPKFNAYANKNLGFVRYHNSILIALTSEESGKFIDDLEKFIRETYAGVTNLSVQVFHNRFYFLEYEFKIEKRKIKVRVPQSILRQVVLEKEMAFDINQTPWRAKRRGYLLNKSDLEILKTYNRELKGLYNYYCGCENVSQKLGELKHIAETSCLKTLASKHKTTVKQIKQKYQSGDNWGIKEKCGKTVKFFKGFKRKQPLQTNLKIDRKM